MNLRILPLLCFAAWSFICWRWYVCGIKDVCAKPVALSEVAVAPPPAPEPAPEPLSSANSTEKPVEPAPTELSKGSQALAEAAEKDEAAVIDMDDHIAILFPYNKMDKEVDPKVDDYLDQLAEKLKGSSQKVTIVGHTDAVGDAATNLIFSERRAKNIRDILKQKGVSASQIITKGMGESKPIGSNDSPAGRRQNRRVEIFLK